MAVSEQDDYFISDKFRMNEENYFGRLAKMFISQRLLKKPGDFAISRTHNDGMLFSVMSEASQVYHLPILEVDGVYGFENCLYPTATSVPRLVRKCVRSSMNVLSTTVGTEVVLRRLVDPNTEDKDDYSLFGLFLGDDDELDLDKLICRGNIAECYLGKLHALGESERVVIKVMRNYSEDEMDNICRELHISNMLQRFISVDSVMPVRAVKLSGCPYLMVYPFMNAGSYLDFAQQMGSHLSIACKVEVAERIARALADMHFLGLLHCDIGARNIFVKKTIDSGDPGCPSNYKYFLGDFREAVIGKTKKVDPQKPINIRWLAPEVFKTKRLTTATDVFAWGITLYEIFTGNLPYYSMSSDEIRVRLLAGQKIRPATEGTNIPKKILKLMRCCWRTKVSDRPTMDGVWLRLKAIQDHLNTKHGLCSECDIHKSNS